eukprot:850683-Rhodomonas_salina.1
MRAQGVESDSNDPVVWSQLGLFSLAESDAKKGEVPFFSLALGPSEACVCGLRFAFGVLTTDLPLPGVLPDGDPQEPHNPRSVGQPRALDAGSSASIACAVDWLGGMGVDGADELVGNPCCNARKALTRTQRPKTQTQCTQSADTQIHATR